MIEKLARAEAESISQKTITECGFVAFPICPFEIAKRHEIHVEPKESTQPGVSGFLMRVGDTFGIKYASQIANEGFQRFTVAHELGHYFLPGHAEALFPSGTGIHHSSFLSTDPLERQADWFASVLLMPEFLFKKAVDRAGYGFSAIEKLSLLCKASILATAIRFTQFTDDAVALIVSTGNKVEYCFMSERIKSLPGITWIKKGTLVPSNSTTSRFNKIANNIESAQHAEGACHLDLWFDGAPDVEVNEDVDVRESRSRVVRLECLQYVLWIIDEIQDVGRVLPGMSPIQS